MTTFTATHGVGIASIKDADGAEVRFTLDRERTGNSSVKVFSLEADEKVAAAISKLPEKFLAEYGITAVDGGAAASSSEKPLKSFTVDELKAYADEHDIDLGDAAKKAEILAAIEAGSED